MNAAEARMLEWIRSANAALRDAAGVIAQGTNPKSHSGLLLELHRLTATHRCKRCGALWHLYPPDDSASPDNPLRNGAWRLATRSCEKCCDNVPMRDQIEPLDVRGGDSNDN